jgi:hypothetical protein
VSDIDELEHGLGALVATNGRAAYTPSGLVQRFLEAEA